MTRTNDYFADHGHTRLSIINDDLLGGEVAETENILLYIVDRDNSGGITFGDFMDFLSSLSKGSEEEKILWSFRFYDINKDGIISRDEMIKVCDSITFLATPILFFVGKAIPLMIFISQYFRLYIDLEPNLV